AKQLADILGHEAGDIEGALTPRLLRAGAHVVAVVERLRPAPLHLEHRLDLDAHPGLGARDVALWIAGPQRGGLGEPEALRDVAVQRTVRRGLLRTEIRDRAAPDELRVDVGRVGADADRPGAAALHRLTDRRERMVEVVDALVQVARLQAL